MNLLLLLSALLSALTGLSPGARMEAPQAVSQGVADAAPVAAVRTATPLRFAAPRATLHDVAAAAPVAIAAPVLAPIALLTNRRRE